ncbi:alcohol dehydrogenase [Leucobacter sp. UCD-THU]|uniref:NAD(P)-dependent alcohol dehydrogenase n=1 Tax=Leucobacter sp. UCD-THU TaxID=1292023 RepID=UPI00037BED26|nr:NAD(P)-dependent alcohol dehydrogenase [Leucobacter sp. UCD-THU]EYT52493.1 alcohol dehydrogenase [Leucobacter sp. UCD-THU]
MKAKAAVVNAGGADFDIETIVLDEPKIGEVLIRVVASGICHTDVVARDQGWTCPLPAVLGHEGSGVVEKVGEGVVGLAAGDHVIMTPSHCGQCDQCRSGRPFVCERFFELNYYGKMDDGTSRHHNEAGEDLTNFFGQASFGTYTIANSRYVTKVDKDVDLELLAPLGCGVETGSGAVLNRLRPEGGSSIAIFGAGSVGLSALMAAAAVGCGTIIAVDVLESRLELAKELGATHVINPKEVESVPDEIKRILPKGLNYAVETAGAPGVLRTAVDSLGIRGVVCQIAAPPLGQQETLDVNDIMLSNKTITGVVQGDSVPAVFIPRLVELLKQGRLPLEKMVTYYDLDDINQAVEDGLSGKTTKAILRMK